MRLQALLYTEGHLIGVSDRGELMIGDKKGRFDRIRFSKQFIFSIVAKGKDIYVCTDKGLFQLAYIRNQVTLLSVKLGIPVTDVDLQGDSLYMATLFQGIQMYGCLVHINLAIGARWRGCSPPADGK